MLPALAVLSALAAAAWAHPQRGSPRGAAVRAALSAFGVARHSGAEIVFALPGPLPAGTVVSEGGPSRPGSSGLIARSRLRVVARVRKPAWFFYEDLAPFQQFSHPGRVALVDAGTGRVLMTAKLSWPPVLGGRLPPFLSSSTAYHASRYRVFYRPYSGSAALSRALSPRLIARARAAVTAPTPSAAGPLAAALAGERACALRFSDTIPGGYYAFARVAQSRAGFDYRLSQLARLAPGFRTAIYPAGSPESPAAFVSRLIASGGCREVLVWMAGGGYAGATAVNIGMRIGRRLLHQEDAGCCTRTSRLPSYEA